MGGSAWVIYISGRQTTTYDDGRERVTVTKDCDVKREKREVVHEEDLVL